MKYRAIIQQTDKWWIGWLVDFPGVNAQEKTKGELLESLRVGAEDMLKAEVEVPPDGLLELVEVP
ncbi:MAG: type II toxin-antitoxin system HicB family antitoxin [Candidatus Zixiibacteriota bacterium]